MWWVAPLSMITGYSTELAKDVLLQIAVIGKIVLHWRTEPRQYFNEQKDSKN